MENVISMEKVNKAFLPGVRVIDDLSFSVQKGEIVGILGPNGAGKTTTIRLLNGVIYPDAGRICVAGFDPVTAGDEIRKRCGVLTESAGLYEHMTARENLLFFAELYGVAEPVRQAEGYWPSLAWRTQPGKSGDFQHRDEKAVGYCQSPPP